jgi:hypothetical protein
MNSRKQALIKLPLIDEQVVQAQKTTNHTFPAQKVAKKNI